MIMFSYFVFVLFFLISKRYQKNYVLKGKNISQEDFISIIVPAKDEEENISDIIESLLEQNYEKDKFEIIIVNDRSVDKTEEVINEYVKENSNLKLITIKEKHPILYGKQNALDIGIKNAKGNIIIITDADCIVSKNWIKTMTKMFYKDDIGLVVGKVEIIVKEKYFKYKVQAIIHRLLCNLAQIPIMFGVSTSGFGNNLAFRKKAYFDVGGYEGLGSSILDDEILIRGISRKGYGISAAFSANAVVRTKPKDTYKEMFNQHKRWIFGGLNIFSTTGILIFLFVFFQSYMFYLIFTKDLSVIYKFVAEFLIIMNLNRECGKENRILRLWEKFLVIIFFNLYNIALLIGIIIKPNVVWKNQTCGIKKKEDKN